MADIELHRDFNLDGTDITEFLDAVKSMAQMTQCLPLRTERLGLGAIVDNENDAYDIAIASNSNVPFADITEQIWTAIKLHNSMNELVVYHCDPLGKFRLQAMKIDKMMEKEGMTEELLNELQHQSKMFISVDGRNCVVSDLAFSTLNSRAKLGGEAMSKPSVGRVVECAKAFYRHRPQDIQMITRTKGDISTVVAAHSGKYCYVPQTVLCDIYERLVSDDYGRSECLHWAVNHEISYCYLGFPDIAEEFASIYNLPDTIIPGIYFSTSDTGDGSIIVRGVWDINGRVISGQTVKRNHRGEVDVDEFVKKAWETIFAEYHSIPTRMAELLTISIENPHWTLRSIFKQVEMSKAANLGSKTAAILYKELANEFDPKGKYSAYDIAMAVATITDRCIGMHHSVAEKMQALAHKAIFADYTRKPKKGEPEDGLFVLT